MNLIALTSRLPKPGETIKGDSFYTSPGGKGGNQAVAVARMGARVRMVGRVGADRFGGEMLDAMKHEGIDVSGVAEDAENASGIAMILLNAERQNHIVQIRGANLACDQSQVDAVERALEGAQALMLQLELPFEVSLQAARYAKARGVRVVWDPAPAMEDIKTAYDRVDVLVPNQSEAEILTGVEVKGPDDARVAAHRLLDAGVPMAVVKMAEQGAYFASAHDEGFVEAPSVDVVDTVAAGDAFGGAFTMALSEGKRLSEAVRWGVAAGALAVTKRGAQDSMPSRGEVLALLARNS